MAGGTSVFRRELNIWEAVGISVALMAPSMAANINPQGVIGSVGRAVPLTSRWRRSACCSCRTRSYG